jgi:tetratricopeptide (TPR) repeat protein
VLKEAKNGSDIADRRVVFPIFSGLFILLKMGHIKQDEACSYEQGLVARFVEETKASGDPVHYTRALAMQAETYARLGDFERAISTQNRARAIYDPEQHSASICKAYGSDRTAQCISLSAIWHVEVGNIDEALRTCDFVICELMPKMEPSNVHNSGVILSPVIWILKDSGMALKAKDLFEKYVVNAFDQYFDEGATTFLLAMYDPTVMMLDLHGNQGAEVASIDKYLSWALCEDNLRFGDVIKNAMLIYGFELDCISAEICLLLARRLDDADQKETLIKNGLLLSQESAELASRLKAIPSLRRARPILRELKEAAQELGLLPDLESNDETTIVCCDRTP